MTPSVFHPATIRLLWLQSRGRRRRMQRRFYQPRRLVLSAVACVLAVIWLGNAAMTVWLRDAAAPQSLRAMLSLGLVVYAIWHLAKAAFFRPEFPFDWTPAERDLLAAMPLLPRDLVAYQLASVTVTTVLKAGLFTLLLLPDLRCLPLGVIGLVLALLTLELVRMTVDIATWGMGRVAFLAYRTAIVAGLVAGGFAVGAVIAGQDAFARINVGAGLLQRFSDILVQLNASAIGAVALPFRPFIDLILADRVTTANMGLAAAALASVTLLAAGVIVLYAAMVRRVVRRERCNYRPNGDPSSATHGIFASSIPHELVSAPSAVARQPLRRPMRFIPRWGGVGALAWRQLVGARRHWGSLLAAMIAPTVLAAAPCFVIADAGMAFLFTMGTLAFYTFLLLPTALRFDFRRDLDRLVILKGLPVTSSAAAAGQVFAPVLIASLFQCGILTLTVVARSLPPELLVLAMLIMVPLNVLVFGLDNLIYLLYPYRMQQEGLEIFLRTVLTFTGKGLLFTVGLLVMAAWGFTAAALTRGIAGWAGVTMHGYTIFAAGMIAGPSLLAALVLHELARTYRHMDPIEDLPR
jgi:hypothetical protein